MVLESKSKYLDLCYLPWAFHRYHIFYVFMTVAMAMAKMYPQMTTNGHSSSDMMLIFAQAAAFIYKKINTLEISKIYTLMLASHGSIPTFIFDLCV